MKIKIKEKGMPTRNEKMTTSNNRGVKKGMLEMLRVLS
jgi:hypothetical protein